MSRPASNRTNPIPIHSPDSESDSDSSIFASTTMNNNPTPQRQQQQQQQDKNTQKLHQHHHHQSRRSITRMHTREIRHTAHCILSSKELLLLHGLASHESVPRTRRRFLAQVLEPDEPEKALRLALDLDRTITPTLLSAGRGSSAADGPGARKTAGGSGGVSSTPAIGAIRGSTITITTAAAAAAAAAGGRRVVDIVEQDDEKAWEMWRRSSSYSKSASQQGLTTPRGKMKMVTGSSSTSPSGSARRKSGHNNKNSNRPYDERAVSGSSVGTSTAASPTFGSPLPRSRAVSPYDHHDARRYGDGDGDVEMEDFQ